MEKIKTYVKIIKRTKNMQPISELFLNYCELGDTKNLQRVVQLYFPKKISSNILFHEENPIKLICENGHSQSLSYILSSELLNDLNSLPSIEKLQKKNKINIIAYECFLNACKNGNLQIAKILLESSYIEEPTGFNDKLSKGFFFACQKGHLPLVIYLSDFLKDNSPQKIKPLNNSELHQGFLQACEHQQLQVLEYLIKNEALSKRLDIHSLDDLALSQAGLRGDVEIVKFLLTQKLNFDGLSKEDEKLFMEFSLQTIQEKDLSQPFEIIKKSPTLHKFANENGFLNVYFKLYYNEHIHNSNHQEVRSNSENYFSKIEELIFELNLKRNYHLDKFISSIPDKEGIEKMFLARDIFTEKNIDISSNKIKI